MPTMAEAGKPMSDDDDDDRIIGRAVGRSGKRASGERASDRQEIESKSRVVVSAPPTPPHPLPACQPAGVCRSVSVSWGEGEVAAAAVAAAAAIVVTGVALARSH